MSATADIRAIHTLKGKLGLSEDDYRALLMNLTGVASSKDMSAAQRQQVRSHMQSLAERITPLAHEYHFVLIGYRQHTSRAGVAHHYPLRFIAVGQAYFVARDGDKRAVVK